MRLKLVASFGSAMALAVALALPAGASADPPTLVIGVDHTDNANQQPFPPFNRLFEYTDFFAGPGRQVTVHSGKTLDFRLAPFAFHQIALAPSYSDRLTRPIAVSDSDDPILAKGTGLRKVEATPVFFESPTCGFSGSSPCSFDGTAVLDEGGIGAGSQPVDWKVQINAAPGTYSYFCYIHPGMRGTLNVVPNSRSVTRQDQIDSNTPTQFGQDQSLGLAAESAANVVSFTPAHAHPGKRTYQVQVGVNAATADGYNVVAVDEMLPNPESSTKPQLKLVPGDQVQYLWTDPHNVHSVTFPAPNNPTAPFGFDCGATFANPGPPGTPPPCVDPYDGAPEFIVDPGSSTSGTALTAPAAAVDSGVILGSGFNVPTAPSWTAATNGSTAAGSYSYQCTIHDWMQGTLQVSSSED